MALDEKTISAAKAANSGKKLTELRVGDRDFLVRKPERAEYLKFKRDAADEETREVAIENLVRDVIVHPPLVEFDKLLDELPAVADSLGKQVLRLAGLQNVAEGKGH